MVSATVSALIVLAQTMTSGVGDYGTAGRVIAAPHGGYDQNTEYVARSLGRRLGWGWVAAIGYRSDPLHFWYDVNRPTERRWSYGGFGDRRETRDGRSVFSDYLARVGRAARHAGRRLDLLVEIHGHARRIQTGSGSIRVQAIELATSGISSSVLWRLKRRYGELVRDVPSPLRVPLAVDALDRRYEVGGWEVPFYFRASDAKRIGSLQSEISRRALHFELPSRVRNSYDGRRYYVTLLAELLQDVAADLGLD